MNKLFFFLRKAPAAFGKVVKFIPQLIAALAILQTTADEIAKVTKSKQRPNNSDV